MRMHWTDTAVHYSWWPNWNYQLVYWNEDMPVFSGRTALDADTLLANGYPLFDLEDLDGDDTIRVYKNINEYANEIQGSIISYPQLTVDGNNVYMVYCAMYEDPFKGTNNQNCPQLHGIFGTRSTDGGHSWNNGVSWISYGKDIFYVEDWTTGSPTIFIDNDNIFPAVSKQVMNGKLVVDWMMDVMPDITTNRLANVIAKIIPTDSLGVYNNVEEIKQGLWIDPTGIADNTLEGMKLYPNPATDNLSVAISSNEHWYRHLAADGMVRPRESGQEHQDILQAPHCACCVRCGGLHRLSDRFARVESVCPQVRHVRVRLQDGQRRRVHPLCLFVVRHPGYHCHSCHERH